MGGCRSSVPMLGTGGMPPVRGPALRGPAGEAQSELSGYKRLSFHKGYTLAEMKSYRHLGGCCCECTCSMQYSNILMGALQGLPLILSVEVSSYACRWHQCESAGKTPDAEAVQQVAQIISRFPSGLLSAHLPCREFECPDLGAADRRLCLPQGCVLCQAHQRAGFGRQAQQLPSWLPSRWQLAAAWRPPQQHVRERSASASPQGLPGSCSLPLDLRKICIVLNVPCAGS